MRMDFVILYVLKMSFVVIDVCKKDEAIQIRWGERECVLFNIHFIDQILLHMCLCKRHVHKFVLYITMVQCIPIINMFALFSYCMQPTPPCILLLFSLVIYVYENDMYLTPEQDKPIINMFMLFSYWMWPLNSVQNWWGGKRVLFFCMHSIEEIVYIHNIFLILILGAKHMCTMWWCEWAGEPKREYSFYIYNIDQIGCILNIFFIVAFWYICNFVTYVFMQKVCP